MSKVIVTKEKLDTLANTIAYKSGVPVTMTIDEMDAAVKSIKTEIYLEEKTVTPSEQSQVVRPSENYDGISSVEVGAIPSNYIGSNIPQNDSDDLTASGATVSVPAGYYSENASKSVATATQATPSVSINSTTGLVTATSNQSAGYVSAGTKSGTFQLTTKSGTTITPTEEEQEAVAANVYTTGQVKVGAISSTYVGSDITQRSSSDVTASGPTVTVPGGYYPSSVERTISSTTHPDPSVSINSTTGVVTASHTQSTGYVVGGTTSDTLELSTQGAATITPTETEQTAVAAGKYTTGAVKVGAISSTYVGSGIARRDGDDLTASGATVSVPAGYYSTNASKSISYGGLAEPTITVNSETGKITSTASISSSGYMMKDNSVSNGLQMTTQVAKTVTPTESQQTAVAAGVYTTGAVTVDAIPSTYVGSGITERDSDDLTVSGATVTAPAGYYSSAASKSVASGTAGTPTATKGTVNNHAITVTPSVTNTTGYITGGTKNGTGVTVSASELVSGTYSVTSSGTKDVTNYASASVPAGSATTPTTTITANPTISVSNSGLITATASASQNITPNVTEGYVASGTAGAVTVSGSKTQQLTTQAAKTVTPTEESQQAVAAGVYTTGAVTVAPIPDEYIVPDGTITITQNGIYDVTENAEVDVDISGQVSRRDVANTTGTTLAISGEEQEIVIEPLSVTSNGTYTAPSGTDGYSPVTVNVSPTLQNKTVSPATTQQTVNADSNYDGLGTVTVSAMPSGSAKTPNTTITATPSISVNSSGLITATVSKTQNVTPTVSAGYVSSGTAGTITVSGSDTSQLTTQAAKTVTPSTSSQTAVAAGRYTTGAVTVAAMPSGTAGTPTATKGTVSNHSVTVTPSVTNTTGYITGGTKNGTAVTVAASELVSGSQTVTENDTYDVTNLAELVVDVPSSGSSSYQFIASKTYTVDVASATQVSLENFDTGTTDIWTSDKMVYIKIRDTAGRRNGYYYGGDYVVANTNPGNQLTSDQSYSIFGGSYTCANGMLFAPFAIVREVSFAPTGYGIYPVRVYDTGIIELKARYDSSSYNTRTINGTYRVDVYLLDWPGGISPFNG